MKASSISAHTTPSHLSEQDADFELRWLNSFELVNLKLETGKLDFIATNQGNVYAGPIEDALLGLNDADLLLTARFLFSLQKWIGWWATKERMERKAVAIQVHPPVQRPQASIPQTHSPYGVVGLCAMPIYIDSFSHFMIKGCN